MLINIWNYNSSGWKRDATVPEWRFKSINYFLATRERHYIKSNYLGFISWKVSAYLSLNNQISAVVGKSTGLDKSIALITVNKSYVPTERDMHPVSLISPIVQGSLSLSKIIFDLWNIVLLEFCVGSMDMWLTLPRRSYLVIQSLGPIAEFPLSHMRNKYYLSTSPRSVHSPQWALCFNLIPV